jgi:hypothetical protein
MTRATFDIRLLGQRIWLERKYEFTRIRLWQIQACFFDQRCKIIALGITPERSEYRALDRWTYRFVWDSRGFRKLAKA